MLLVLNFFLYFFNEPANNMLHPCAFFSRKPSPATQLQCWRPWTSSYLHYFGGVATLVRGSQTAIYCLDQSHEPGLFFAHFQFSITYKPGPCNVKPDAPSQPFVTLEDTETPVFIFPSACTVVLLTWRTEKAILEEHKIESYPRGGLADCMYVPTWTLSQVLHSQSSPVIQVCTALYTCNNTLFGGHLSSMMPNNMLMPSMVKHLPGFWHWTSTIWR